MSSASSLSLVPELNKRLDSVSLARDFRLRGRLHIPSILSEPSAARLAHMLQHETPWSVTLNKGASFLDVDRPSPGERARLAQGVVERARAGGFHYVFDNHRLSRNRMPYGDPGHYFSGLVSFLNAPHFLGLMRDITGFADIAWADAQATLYRPGDFLTAHDDRVGGAKRLAAYVLNMTPDWHPGWGGELQFIDPRGRVEETFAPAFNALNIFRVPQFHAVSPVANSGGLRYSVTGWFNEN